MLTQHMQENLQMWPGPFPNILGGAWGQGYNSHLQNCIDQLILNRWLRPITYPVTLRPAYTDATMYIMYTHHWNWSDFTPLVYTSPGPLLLLPLNCTSVLSVE